MYFNIFLFGWYSVIALYCGDGQCFRASGSYVRTPAVMVQHWGLDNSMPNRTVHVTEQVRCVCVTPYLTHSVCSVQYKRNIRFQCTW